ARKADMRHRKSGRKLGRNSSHRDALWRNMVTSLLEHGRIRTTEAKAKELRSFTERTISKAIRVRDTVAKPTETRTRTEQAHPVRAFGMAGRMVGGKEILPRLFNDMAPALASRPGGYTRITKCAPRPGDAAPMAYIEVLLPGKPATT